MISESARKCRYLDGARVAKLHLGRVIDAEEAENIIKPLSTSCIRLYLDLS
jgi:hypothetical protein